MLVNLGIALVLGVIDKACKQHQAHTPADSKGSRKHVLEQLWLLGFVAVIMSIQQRHCCIDVAHALLQSENWC